MKNKISNDTQQLSFPEKKIPLSSVNDDDFVAGGLKDYTVINYINDVESYGLEFTWNKICEFVIKTPVKHSFLNIDTFHELYEIGLELQDKDSKKSSGQYYTPQDVATVMSTWLRDCEGDAICDVACGTGSLILTYLDLIGMDEAKQLIKQNRLFLYDCDRVALTVCKTILCMKYGADSSDCVSFVHCDFLDKTIVLPANAKVISNPPYAAIPSIGGHWEQTTVLEQTKEFYSVFIEKIFKQAQSAVVITPFSFISGAKYYSLRQLMCDKGHGSIISFDNVPATIFCGKKKGVFNTNTANSVRAAITVFHKSSTAFGYRTTHLIRFKAEEREKVLNSTYLEGLLTSDYQLVNGENTMFKKVNRQLTEVFDAWAANSNRIFKDLVSNEGKYTLYIPNTCRYFTVASDERFKRNGQMVFTFTDRAAFNYAFCLLNSSFAYWHWRIYDGGITYTKRLLENMPVFFEKLSDDDNLFFHEITNEMIEKKGDFLVKKNNVGVQENIKYSREYRDKINQRLLRILGVHTPETIFDVIHSNSESEDAL